MAIFAAAFVFSTTHSLEAERVTEYFWKGRVKLDKFYYISPETLTCQPNTDSPEPDFEDIRIMGFGQGQIIETALKDILDLNEDLESTRPDQTFHLDFKNEHRKYFRLKEYKTATRVAS